MIAGLRFSDVSPPFFHRLHIKEAKSSAPVPFKQQSLACVFLISLWENLSFFQDGVK